MLKINDEYYIEGETNDFILKQVHYAEKKDTGEKVRQDLVIGYYATVDIALKGYLKHKGREIIQKKDFESIKEYLDYIKKLDEEMKKCFN